MIAIVLSIIAIVISCSKKYDQTSELYDTTNLKCKSGKNNENGKCIIKRTMRARF